MHNATFIDNGYYNSVQIHNKSQEDGTTLIIIENRYNREYLHSTKYSERPQGVQRAHTQKKNSTIRHQPDYTVDTTQGGLHAHQKQESQRTKG